MSCAWDGESAAIQYSLCQQICGEPVALYQIPNTKYTTYGNVFNLQLKYDRSIVLLIPINVMCGDVRQSTPYVFMQAIE